MSHKKQKLTVQNEKIGTMSQIINYPILERLFEPDRKQRQDLWKFIKLVAPKFEKRKWKTKEAIGAYCIKCQSEITYSSGTSQQILRHMQRYHPDDINDPTVCLSKKRTFQTQLTIGQASKKLKLVDESQSQKGHFLA